MTPWHYGPLIAFDLETTGVDPTTARIVTACVAVVDGTGQRAPEVTTWLVDPGVEIPSQASEIHGITTATARRYERALDTLITALHSKTAPAGDAAGADQTPPTGGTYP